MLYIEPESTDAAFHFATEEFCMQHFGDEHDIFMLWQTERCVMLGCNQIAQAEIDLEAAREMGMQIVRRASGGGTIYTDSGTLLYTVITGYNPDDDIKEIERFRVAGPVIRALNRMGIAAKMIGRNDILVDGRKVSGLAQRVLKKRLCSHGSLLYDADLGALGTVLTVDESKIRAKAITSVRSRVANLCEYLSDPYTVLEFKHFLKKHLMQDISMQEYVFTSDELAQINLIKLQRYANPEWTYGAAPAFELQNQNRFPMGNVEIYLEVKGGAIRACAIRGDFLAVKPIADLEARLVGQPYRAQELRQVLDTADLPYYLGGVTTNEFLSTILV